MLLLIAFSTAHTLCTVRATTISAPLPLQEPPPYEEAYENATSTEWGRLILSIHHTLFLVLVMLGGLFVGIAGISYAITRFSSFGGEHYMVQWALRHLYTFLITGAVCIAFAILMWVFPQWFYQLISAFVGGG